LEVVTASLANTGVLTLTLNRPAARNAFDAALVRSLRRQLDAAAADEAVRAVVVTGAGAHFCAGGDIAWMRAVLQLSEPEMVAAASEIADMLQAAHEHPKPLLALVRGAAMGGGLGLACCADVVVADETAKFGLGEVRLGIIPALISPHLVRAIGQRQATALALLAEPIDYLQAKELGIVTHVSKADLTQTAERLVGSLTRGGPDAQSRTKSVLRMSAATKSIEDASDACVAAIVDAWQAPEAAEGMQAFLEKRPPNWGQLKALEVGTC
jgi:methylglutaconyl-CoA hydratase